MRAWTPHGRPAAGTAPARHALGRVWDAEGHHGCAARAPPCASSEGGNSPSPSAEVAAAVASRGRGRAFLRTLRPVCPSLALTPHTDLSSVALGCHGHRRVASSTLAPSEPELRGFVRSFVRVCGAPFAKHCVGMSLAARLLWRASSRARSLLLVDRRARNRPKRSLTNPLYLLRCARSRSSRLLRLCVHTSSPLPCCPPRRRRRAATLRDPRSVVPIPPRALFDRAPRVLITY